MPALTPNLTLLDVALVKIGGVVWGVTRGGIRRVPGIEVTPIEWDGRRASHTVGLDRVTDWGDRVEFTLLEVPQATIDRLLHVSAGAPARPKAGEIYTVARYLADVSLEWRYPDGKTFAVKYPYALVQWTEMTGEDKSTVELAVALEARLAAGADPDSAPFTMVHTDPGGAGDANLPPARQVDLTWAFDPSLNVADAQTGVSYVGPAWQRGSTVGADANDPAHVTTAPAHYVFDASDYIDFGDSLDTTWTHADGFMILEAVDLVAGDLTNYSLGVSKDNNAAGQRAFVFYIDALTGHLAATVYLAAGSEFIESTVSLTTGKHTIGVSYDRTLAFGVRLKLWLDGVEMTVTRSTTGADGAVVDIAFPTRIGLRSAGDLQAITTQSFTYAWHGAHTAGEVLADDAWIRGAGRGWA